MAEEKKTILQKHQYRPQKWTKEDIYKLSDELEVEVVENEDMLTLLDIYLFCGMGYQRASDYQERYERFREAIDFARKVIGARRERGALKNKLDSSIVRTSMALYCKEMKEHQLELKNSDAERAAHILRLADKGSMDKKKDQAQKSQ